MTCSNNTNKAVITWMSGQKTEHAVDDLPYVRKSSGDGSGWLYMHVGNDEKVTWEKPRDIVQIPADLIKSIEARAQQKLNNVSFLGKPMSHTA